MKKKNFGLSLLLFCFTVLLGCSAAPDNPPSLNGITQEKVGETASSVDPLKIEAESYSAMYGIQTESCSEETLDVGWIDTGDWMEYTVDVPQTAQYTLAFRVASPNSSGKFDFLSGGQLKLSLSTPNTGGWQNWTTVSMPVTLSAGYFRFGVYANTGGFNLNWINIINTGSSSSSSLSSLSRSARVHHRSITVLSTVLRFHRLYPLLQVQLFQATA